VVLIGLVEGFQQEKISVKKESSAEKRSTTLGKAIFAHQ
jgi:hypothetical protein